MQKNTPHLSERDLQTIDTIGRFKYLSSQQIWKEFYATSTPENATQRLTSLHKHGFLSRDFAYPKAVTNPGQRPTAIYFFSQKNKDNLRAYLTTHGKADLCEDFAILPTTDKDDGNSYSNAHLVHEISILLHLSPPGVSVEAKSLGDKQRQLQRVLENQGQRRVIQKLTQIGGVERYKDELRQALADA